MTTGSNRLWQLEAPGSHSLGGREPVAVLEDLGCSPDDAPERIVHDERRYPGRRLDPAGQAREQGSAPGEADLSSDPPFGQVRRDVGQHRSTRLNSSHLVISYAVFCL